LRDVLLVIVAFSTLVSGADYYVQYRRLPGKDAAP